MLGSINLSEFVKDNNEFDYKDFESCVRAAVIALNDVLDEGLSKHPLAEQRECVGHWRQIGLGVMGIADMLIKLGIRYGSKESLDICDNIARMMIETAIEQSQLLADTRGEFEGWNDNIYKSDFFKSKHVSNAKLRNSQLLTIAPCGTLSTMIGCSGGIEPIFANYYTRLTKSLHNEDVEYKVYTPIVKEYMDKHGLIDDSQLPDYFVTSRDIDFKDRINMQSVWQEHIDASISSTINLPNETTVEQVEELYMYAWERGLKGVTIFRDGCARMPVLSTESKKEESTQSDEMKRGYVEPPRQDLLGLKRDLVTGCGTLHVSAYFDPITNELKECFLSKGSTGGCNNYMIGLSRLISLSARAGVHIKTIADQLNSTGVCPSYAVRRATKKDTSDGTCCAMAVGNALIDMWEQMKHASIEDIEYAENEKEETDNDKCPECGHELLHENGCIVCKNCGWSRCN